MPVRYSWRILTDSEIDQPWRKSSKDHYVVARGDFDGDGKPDEARIMLSRHGSRAAIVVDLSGSGQTVIHEEPDAGSVLATFGIKVLPPGSHRTACGKGYGKCGPHEPDVLTTRWHGVDYFMVEGADSVFYVPERGAGFRRIWLSD